MRSIRPLPLLLALFAACADPTAADPSAVVLFTDRASYRTGTVVSVTLSNGSDVTVGLNACHVEGERRSGDAWRRISPLRLCTEDLDRVAPGAAVTFQEPMAREWEPGLYRILVPVVFPGRGERVEVSTEPFRIEP